MIEQEYSASEVIGEAISLHSVSLDAGVPDRIHLLPIGTFKGRDGRGPWVVKDRTHAAQIIKRTQQTQGSADLAVDFEHSGMLSAPKGQPSPAAGWIKGLEIASDGIWGRVEWTKSAAQKIRDKEYRYISPVFAHLQDGTVTRLGGAGLVINPNLELTALNSKGATMPGDVLSTAKTLLGMDGSDDATFLAAIGSLTKLSATFKRVLKLPDDTPLSGILDALLQRDNAQPETACGVEQAFFGSKESPVGFVPMALVETMAVQTNQLRQELLGVHIERAVEDALNQGKISPALRGWATALCASNPDSFTAFAERMPPIFAHLFTSPFEGLPSTPATKGAYGLNDEELSICRKLGHDPKEFAKIKETNQ